MSRHKSRTWLMAGVAIVGAAAALGAARGPTTTSNVGWDHWAGWGGELQPGWQQILAGDGLLHKVVVSADQSGYVIVRDADGSTIGFFVCEHETTEVTLNLRFNEGVEINPTPGVQGVTILYRPHPE